MSRFQILDDSEFDFQDFQRSADYQFNENNMNLKAISGAVLSAVIISVFGYLASLADLWTLNIHILVTVAFGAFITSITKFVGTTSGSGGNFAGIVPTAVAK